MQVDRGIEYTTMMFLVIKGNTADAQLQARLRSIDLLVDSESDNHNEVYCYAPLSDRGKIIAWYAEDQGIAKLAERGECLWYAERKVKHSA